MLYLGFSSKEEIAAVLFARESDACRVCVCVCVNCCEMSSIAVCKTRSGITRMIALFCDAAGLQ